MVRKGIFLTIGEHFNFVYYPIVSYQWINVYRVERVYIGSWSPYSSRFGSVNKLTKF